MLSSYLIFFLKWRIPVFSILSVFCADISAGKEKEKFVEELVTKTNELKEVSVFCNNSSSLF